jgi:hypothetical protein
MKCNRNIVTIFIVSISLLVIVFPRPVLADATKSVNATVKISICGNGIAEDREACDGGDLKGNTCKGLGYGSGTLLCDASCSFDTSACIVPKSVKINPTEAVFPAISTLSPKQNFLSFPKNLFYFGANQNGMIEKIQLHASVKSWVSEWKKYLANISTETNPKCDLTGNKICDVDDFSIMLYHVQP